MESPHPPVPLQDHCSVIQNGTLYVYSPQAFQSLQLKEGGLWSKLKNGVPVSGASCVKGTDADGSQALWVIGGRSSDSSSNYSGLQKYSFLTKGWTTLTPTVLVTKNRQGHAATYLEGSKSILVYSGSQDGSNIPSIETFTISAAPPHNVESFTSKNQPVVSPVLLPWNEQSAVAMGGIMPNQQPNRQIYRFTKDGGWKRYQTKLEQEITSDSQSKATIIQGSDGSKVLTTFNLGTSPNQVQQIVLQRPNGSPAPDGQTIGMQQQDRPAGGKSPRALSLTLQQWPTYNGTMAPSAPRTGFDLTTDPTTGVVAISGGNPSNPIALFNEQKNTWVDTTTFFGPDSISQSYLGPSSTSSLPTSTATSTPSSTSTGAAASGDNDHSKTGLILGATLGSILGVIVLLIVILLYLRHRRSKLNQQNGQSDDEKQRLSFADRGAPYMMEQVHISKPMMTSHDSMAIMSGNLTSSNHRRSATGGSASSTARLVPKAPGIHVHDAVEMTPIHEKSSTLMVPGTGPGAAGSNASLLKPKRSSGWSRYFSGNELAMQGTGIRASNSPSTTESRPNSARPKSRKSLKSWKSGRSSQGTASVYATSLHDCNSHGPTEIPPLNLGQQFDEDRVSSSLSKDTKSAEASVTTRTRADTMSSEMSSIPPSTATGTIFSEEVHDDSNQWSPITKSDWTGPRARDTTTSSIYSHTPKDVVGISRTDTYGQYGAPASNPPPSGASKQPQPTRTSHMSLFPKTPERVSMVQDRTSYYQDQDEFDDVVVVKAAAAPAQTAIPIPASTAMPITVKKTSGSSNKPGANTDMSWVSLKG